MHFTTVVSSLLALTLATSVRAVALPDGLRNGVHILDARGQLLDFQPVDARDIVERDEPQALERRFPGPEVGCNFVKLNQKDLATATKMITRWCDAGYKVNAHNKAVFRFGNAITFVCSYGNEQGCSSGEFSEAQGLWNTRCDNKVNEGGYVYIKDWAKTYGQDVGNADPCGNLAESDPKVIAAQVGGLILGGIAKGLGKK